MEHLLVVEMYAVSVLQITVLLVPLDLFSGMFHELIKLLISAQFHLIHHSQGRVEFSLFMPQMRLMNVKYSSIHL
jgi:sterol desaturase/sphingolipid hydroxylase (fatty acid hydroxylase superfamily)